MPKYVSPFIVAQVDATTYQVVQTGRNPREICLVQSYEGEKYSAKHRANMVATAMCQYFELPKE